ncbi:MAG: D-alanyl-D-alanine carboxypeptidase/D-alanyl-D-alanine-endopeptidase [Sandaracinaceae bacterium]|nr:D-alanyl-D-alanine carboxypeptidase/D-alanyl-D-alanine-endopeptidase [Sandaracinaceae bacterium]
MRNRALFILLLGLWLAAPAQAQDAAGDTLVGQLRSLVASSGLSEEVGVAVVDIRTGRPVFQHHAERPMNPASNQKLVTAFAALRLLGADFSMRTAAQGSIEGGAVRGGLALRGFGDPDLDYGDLVELARDVRLAGVDRVDRVIVDATYFDDQILPAAFDQQPNEVAAFRAPIGAVSVERNAYVLRVMPGADAGATARVELLGAGYFDLTNRITTSATGAPNVIADQRTGDSPTQMILRLSGSVPATVRGVSYRRRIENPLYWSGHVFRDALRSQGIEVGDRVSVEATPAGAPVLATHQSPPVGTLIHALGKHSDNFVAEMLFRVMGAERHQPGRGEDGVAAVRGALDDAGIDTAHIDIVNGSGLFDGNRIAPQRLADLLVTAYRDPAVRPDFVASLSIAGVDGTMSRRLRDLPAPRIVRVKTGTLAAVIALSGYVLGPEPGQAYAFSFLANDVRGRGGQARQLADGIARQLAEQIYRAH